MDRISRLQDETIRLIVRFLGAKDAARVLSLSKRFMNLYTIIEVLEFDDEGDFHGNFPEFVSGSLAVLVPATCVRRFSLKSRTVLDSALINHWLGDVLERSVMDLELCLHHDNGDSIPLEIFSCKTLVKLKLGREFVIRVLPHTALLPSLESLTLSSVQFEALDGCAFKALLLACPLLKELTIDGMHWERWKWSGNLSSPSLERLTITRDLSQNFAGPAYQGITFDTPSLTLLDYTDFVPDAYPVVNFKSLVEARLDLQVVNDHEWVGVPAADGDLLSSDPSNLIQGIKNVKTLVVSSSVTFETLYFFRGAIPVFENLQHLSMTRNDLGSCLRFLPFLLEKSPNLKTLLIECALHYVQNADNGEYVCDCLGGYCFLLSCHVEVLGITLWDSGNQGELEQLKHFLGKLPRLELLKVRIRESLSEKEKLRITMDLLMLPRASSKCKIEIVFFTQA